MTYINTTVTEGELLKELQALLVANGWTYEKGFKKIAYPSSIIHPTTSTPSITPVGMSVAEHKIFSNSQGLYYGIAKVYNFEEQYGKIPNAPKTSPEDKKLFETWLSGKYKPFHKDCVLYFYMCENIPSVVEGGTFGCAVETTNSMSTERGSVDIEVEKSDYIPSASGGSHIFEYTEFYEDRQQSPFPKSTLRNSNLTKTDVATNWWADSLIRIQGRIDTEHVFVVIQADNTPAFRDNVVPTIPLYWGRFVSFKDGDVGNDALWCGTAFDTGTESGSHSFDYKSSTPYRDVKNFLPIKKTYPNYPGNGIDNVIVKRGELGARYQAYYLSWNTGPQLMPPDRVGKDGGQYPLSWTTQDNDEYKYQFNPSMYSKKIHTSRAYLIHPDEGVRGYMPKMVILSPMGLVNEDKLKVRTATCPDTFDIYRFFLTSAISPVSKRPGTVYTPAGIGIFEKGI